MHHYSLKFELWLRIGRSGHFRAEKSMWSKAIWYFGQMRSNNAIETDAMPAWPLARAAHRGRSVARDNTVSVHIREKRL